MQVTFADQPEIRFVDKVKNFEHVLIWWQTADFKRFKQQNAETVKLVADDESVDDSRTRCMRGLEHWTSEEKEERTDRRVEAFLVVMRSQKSLRRKGVADGFGFASAYRRETTDSRERALARGLADEAVRDLEEEVVFKRGSGLFKRTSDIALQQRSREAAAKMRSSFTHFSKKIMPAAA